jgi:hypothetical protein
MKDSEKEAFLMSEELVNELVEDIVRHIGKSSACTKRMDTMADDTTPSTH